MENKVNVLFLISPLLFEPSSRELQSYLPKITSKLQSTYLNCSFRFNLQSLSSNPSHPLVVNANVEQWKDILPNFPPPVQDFTICDTGWDAGQELLESFVLGLENLLSSTPQPNQVDHVIVITPNDFSFSVAINLPLSEGSPVDLALLTDSDWGCGARDIQRSFWNARDARVGWQQVRELMVKFSIQFTIVSLGFCPKLEKFHQLVGLARPDFKHNVPLAVNPAIKPFELEKEHSILWARDLQPPPAVRPPPVAPPVAVAPTHIPINLKRPHPGSSPAIANAQLPPNKRAKVQSSVQPPSNSSPIPAQATPPQAARSQAAIALEKQKELMKVINLVLPDVTFSQFFTATQSMRPRPPAFDSALKVINDYHTKLTPELQKQNANQYKIACKALKTWWDAIHHGKFMIPTQQQHPQPPIVPLRAQPQLTPTMNKPPQQIQLAAAIQPQHGPPISSSQPSLVTPQMLGFGQPPLNLVLTAEALRKHTEAQIASGKISRAEAESAQRIFEAKLNQQGMAPPAVLPRLLPQQQQQQQQQQPQAALPNVIWSGQIVWTPMITPLPPGGQMSESNKTYMSLHVQASIVHNFPINRQELDQIPWQPIFYQSFLTQMNLGKLRDWVRNNGIPLFDIVPSKGPPNNAVHFSQFSRFLHSKKSAIFCRFKTAVSLNGILCIPNLPDNAAHATTPKILAFLCHKKPLPIDVLPPDMALRFMNAQQQQQQKSGALAELPSVGRASGVRVSPQLSQVASIGPNVGGNRGPPIPPASHLPPTSQPSTNNMATQDASVFGNLSNNMNVMEILRRNALQNQNQARVTPTTHNIPPNPSMSTAARLNALNPEALTNLLNNPVLTGNDRQVVQRLLQAKLRQIQQQGAHRS